MNKGHIFDDITRITARAGVDISRRKALSLIVGTVAYGALGGIGLGRKALAGTAGVCVKISGGDCKDNISLAGCKPLFSEYGWVGNVSCCSPTSSNVYLPSNRWGACIYNGSTKCTDVPEIYYCGSCLGGTPQENKVCCPTGIKVYDKTGISGQYCLLKNNTWTSVTDTGMCIPCYGGTKTATPGFPTKSFSGGTISFSSNCGFSNVSASGNNCEVNISGYNCTTGSVTVKGTKIDTSQSASISATAVDCTGLTASVDPVMTTLSLTTGRWVRQTFTDIPKAESYISVTNNNPGLKTLDVRVNSHYHKTLELRTNETKTINVAEAMTTGNHNTVSLMGQGKLGASADVTISDTPPPSQPNTKISHDKKLSHRENNIWGHIAEELHETSDFHNADVSTQTVLITFKGDLDSFSAGNIGLYNVDVNGRPVVVQKANAQPQADGVELLLQLPRNTLKNGNTVDVYWEYLQDKEGQPLAGHVSLIAQRSH